PLNIEKNSDEFRSHRGYLYPNLYFSKRATFDVMIEDYETAIKNLKNAAERNFLLAMNDKRKAMFYAKYCYERGIPLDENKLDNWLKEALNHYYLIDKDSLGAKVSSTVLFNGDGVRTTMVTRKNLFIYPDYRDGWFSWSFHTDYFFRYLHKNGLLGKIFQTGEDLQALHLWVTRGFDWRVYPPLNAWYKDYPISDKDLTDILSFVDHHPDGKQFDENLLCAILSERAFERGDSALGLDFYHRIDQANLPQSINKYEYLEKTFLLNVLKQLTGNLATSGKMNEAIRLADIFTDENDKVIAYTHMAKKMYEMDADPETFEYLDSAFLFFRKTDYSSLHIFSTDSRNNLIMLLSEIGGESLNNKAREALLDIPESRKFTGILARVIGVAQEGNYYLAYTSIPNSLTESEDLQSRTMILMQACKANEKKKGGDAQWKSMDDFIDWIWNYIDYIPV
ncbi:MAG TPA: hypothetical protein VKR32_02055, partial [Puia sp.]|nr:hypothetical protein [Puia sp.]